ncbi:MAG: hypothetical protein ACOYLS_10035 [Polymorphobacter sp.]
MIGLGLVTGELAAVPGAAAAPVVPVRDGQGFAVLLLAAEPVAAPVPASAASAASVRVGAPLRVKAILAVPDGPAGGDLMPPAVAVAVPGREVALFARLPAAEPVQHDDTPPLAAVRPSSASGVMPSPAPPRAAGPGLTAAALWRLIDGLPALPRGDQDADIVAGVASPPAPVTIPAVAPAMPLSLPQALSDVPPEVAEPRQALAAPPFTAIATFAAVSSTRWSAAAFGREAAPPEGPAPTLRAQVASAEATPGRHVAPLPRGLAAQPAPVAAKSLPVTEQPIPVAAKPIPVAAKPMPVAAEPMRLAAAGAPRRQAGPMVASLEGEALRTQVDPVVDPATVADTSALAPVVGAAPAIPAPVGASLPVPESAAPIMASAGVRRSPPAPVVIALPAAVAASVVPDAGAAAPFRSAGSAAPMPNPSAAASVPDAAMAASLPQARTAGRFVADSALPPAPGSLVALASSVSPAEAVAASPPPATPVANAALALPAAQNIAAAPSAALPQIASRDTPAGTVPPLATTPPPKPRGAARFDSQLPARDARIETAAPMFFPTEPAPFPGNANRAAAPGGGDASLYLAAPPPAADSIAMASARLGAIELRLEGGPQDLRVQLSGSAAAGAAMAAEAPRLVADLGAGGIRLQSLDIGGQSFLQSGPQSGPQSGSDGRPRPAPPHLAAAFTADPPAAASRRAPSDRYA